MRSAPGTPAAIAICFGRLREPSKPPPANPLRMLVTRNIPSSSSNSAFEPSAIESSESPRRSTATSFSSSTRLRRVAGEADRRSPAPRTRLSGRRRRARVDRQVRARLAGHVPPEVRQPPGHRHAEAGGRGLVALVERAQRSLELGLCLLEVGGALARAQRRGHHLVVERRHDHLDLVVHDHRQPVEQVLLRAESRHAAALGRLRQLVDEPVDAGRRQRACGRRPQQPSSRQSQRGLKQSAGARRDPCVIRSRFFDDPPVRVGRSDVLAKPCRGIRRASMRTGRATRRCPGWPCTPWR